MTLLHSKEVEEGNTKKATTHDFFQDRRWITFISGYSDSSDRAYILYKMALFCLFVYMMMSCVLACVFQPERKIIMDAIPQILLNIFGVWATSTRYFTRRSITKVQNMIKAGVYIYDNEKEDLVLIKMKEAIPNEIRRKSNIFIVIYVIGALSNGVLYPISQTLLLEPGSYKNSDVINPYLPMLFYQPFDTRTRVGYVIGFSLGVVFFICLYSVATAYNWIYLSYSVQLKVHFTVLNHSLATLQERAQRLYSSIHGSQTKVSVDAFECCVYSCFKANIRHHQELLRFSKVLEKFYGMYILYVFTMTSSIFATQLYLMYQVPPTNVMVILVASFVAEQFSVIYVCVLGEDVIKESGLVFRELYGTSWYDYSERTKQAMQIMMANTMKPMGLKALLLGAPASLEIYGDIMSAMYKLCNLARQKDIT